MKKISLKKDPFYEREACKYPKPIPSREYIMQYLDELGRPASYEHLQRAFALRSTEAQEALRRRLIAMARDGQLIANRRGSFALVDKMALVRGLVVAHKDGYGFVISEDGGEDIFLSTRQMRSLFHEDRVLVRVIDGSKGKRREGAVVEILERNTKQIVGRYFEESGVAFIVPANKNIIQDIIVPRQKKEKEKEKEKEKQQAKPGQLVVAEIISYPNLKCQATAKIIEIIGKHMAPGMEIEVAVRAHDLPHKWSQDILNAAETLPKKIFVQMVKGRKDLRKLPFVTIDSEDAKDFDDAIYCQQHPKGGWHLYVAIADVSYYVKPNTPLDQEALLRGNSVYFPEKTIPMLPEILANDLCSLKPELDRLCMVCEISISKDGKINRYSFYEAVICSHARLTYTQVANMLAEKRKGQIQLLPYLPELFALYKVLQSQREKRGAIEFETIETKIIFGKGRKISKILPQKRNIAHKIVEECMLAANVCAARFLLKKKIPALYRIHEGPDAEKLENLRSFLSGLGLKLTGGANPEPRDYSLFMKKIKGRNDEHLIQTMLLRSMRQAVYDAENIGHFGLAYDAYGHFTSPIRRYPDLLAHRAIRHAIRGGSLIDFCHDNSAIHNFGEHCSMTERRADDAVGDAIDWLKCEYMLDKIGKQFPGIISGVTGFGVFIELKDIYVEGLLHITSLTNDYYEYDPVRHSLRGKRLKKKYCLGDSIKVRVARVDLDEREIDFELV